MTKERASQETKIEKSEGLDEAVKQTGLSAEKACSGTRWNSTTAPGGSVLIKKTPTHVNSATKYDLN